MSGLGANGIEGSVMAGHSQRCPLCHVDFASAPDTADATTEWWQCAGCGQSWSAGRLLVVAAYARYAAAQ